jgi:hypothetical protein
VICLCFNERSSDNLIFGQRVNRKHKKSQKKELMMKVEKIIKTDEEKKMVVVVSE